MLPLPSHNQHNQHSYCSDNSNVNFSDSFKDFFAKLSPQEDENDECIESLLENKQLLPSKSTGEDVFWRKLPERHWSTNRVSLRRRTGEFQRQGNSRAEGKVQQQNSFLSHATSSGVLISPMVTRRRSSSAGVATGPPDLNRFLQSEHQRVRVFRSQNTTSPESVTFSKMVSSQPSKYNTPLELTYSRHRTASMPVVPTRNRPMLIQTKRSDDGLEYYRLRSFSITPNGICNLGDSFKSRRSLSINSVNSSESSQTEFLFHQRSRLPSTASQNSSGINEEYRYVPKFRVAMLGASGVGKTAFTYQFTTSEYICAYNASLDDEFGQKTVSVMVDGQETELEIIDHPSSEMSVEAFCSTYNPDVYVVVYSVVDRTSLKVAEDILMYLWKNECMASKGVILVGNKADLERKREVPATVGRKLANNCGCKFIETSSGLDHNVDELLVGILAQVKLNPKRRRHYFSKKKKNRISKGRRLLKHILGLKRKSKSCENLFIL